MNESRAEKIWAFWQVFRTIAITLAAGVVVIYFSSITEQLNPFVKYLVMFLGVLIILSGILLAVLKDIKSRFYYCEKCGHKFIPAIGDFFKGNKCPKCQSEAKYHSRDIKL